MAEKNRGMGRGLAAILSVSDRTPNEQEELRSLPLDLISPSPSQPRKAFDDETLQGLAESLSARGVLASLDSPAGLAIRPFLVGSPSLKRL